MKPRNFGLTALGRNISECREKKDFSQESLECVSRNSPALRHAGQLKAVAII
jgi:hypothetical protein